MNKINDIHINSITYGNPQGQDVVLLHGWGQNIEMMKPIGDSLQKEYLVTIIDLPGHGMSDEPKSAWQLDDFVEMLNQLFDELKIKKPSATERAKRLQAVQRKPSPRRGRFYFLTYFLSPARVLVWRRKAPTLV